MKNNKMIALLIAILLTLCSCGKETDTPPVSDAPEVSETLAPTDSASLEADTQSLLEYFSTKENTLYVYVGDEDDFTAWNIFNDYVYLDEGVIQRKIEASGQYICELIRFTEGKAIIYYSNNKYGYTEYGGDKPQNTDYLIMKAPLEKGATWLMDEARGGYTHCEITDMEAEVTVPAGTYKAMEIKTTYDDSETYQLQYFVKGIGFIKQETVTSEKTYLTELSAIIEETMVSQDIMFFFPNYETGELDYEVRGSQFQTNADILEYFNIGFNSYADKENSVLAGDSKLLGITMDVPNKLAIVNISNEFAAAAEADAKREKMLLDSIAYTFGMYYGTERVQILLEGKPYSSANITMETDALWEMNASIKAYKE